MSIKLCPHCGEPADHNVELGEEVQLLRPSRRQAIERAYAEGMADGRVAMMREMLPYLNHTADCADPLRICTCGRDALMSIAGYPGGDSH